MANFKLVNKSIFFKVHEYLCHLCFAVVILDILRIGTKDCCMAAFKAIILAFNSFVLNFGNLFLKNRKKFKRAVIMCFLRSAARETASFCASLLIQQVR